MHAWGREGPAAAEYGVQWWPTTGYSAAMDLAGRVLLPGLRCASLTPAQAPALTSLVAEVETAAFGRTETNDTESMATLHAPELAGGRGAAGLWDGHRLVAAALVYDGLHLGRGLFFDVYITPDADPRWRADTARSLLAGVHAYALRGQVPDGENETVETCRGDDVLEAVLADLGFSVHRTYWRMRRDLADPLAVPEPATGYRLRTFDASERDWRLAHEAVQTAFRDHYDHHPLPLGHFREINSGPATDLSRWRLVTAADSAVVAVCQAGLRYAERGYGYVEVLGVLREHRHRGLARLLLLNAFDRDRQDGLRGTLLHCDASNPTGATALYQSVGMVVDQTYLSWRRPLKCDS